MLFRVSSAYAPISQPSTSQRHPRTRTRTKLWRGSVTVDRPPEGGDEPSNGDNIGYKVWYCKDSYRNSFATWNQHFIAEATSKSELTAILGAAAFEESWMERQGRAGRT